MAYLLDTNCCITYLRNPASTISKKMAMLPRGEVFVCSIVAGELYYGALRSARITENVEKVRTFLNTMTSLPFDDSAARNFAEIRAELAASGSIIGPYDLQIAAIARTNDLILVTHNTGEFRRVSGLSIEDWEV